MAEWKVVAQGTSFSNLQQTVGDMVLPKGSRVRVVMDTLPLTSWVFDLAGVENAFLPVVPEGMTLVDVWSEEGKGYVEMEADPAWLGAVVLGLPVWAWLAIGAVGSLVILGTIVAFIVVMIKMPKAAIAPLTALAIGGGLALIGILAAMSMKRKGD